MATKYIFVRMKLDDYKKIGQKKESLKADMEEVLGKKIKFSFPQFFTAFANGTLEINPDRAVQLFKIKKIKGGLEEYE